MFAGNETGAEEELDVDRLMNEIEVLENDLKQIFS